MAAGKMFLAARKTRRTRKASGFKKAVTAIAKKAVMTTAETKTGWVQQQSSFGINGVLYSLWQTIAQGDGQSNRDGDEIRSLGVRMRGYIAQDPAVITALQDHNAVRVILASGKRPLTSGDFPTYNGAIDPEVMTVHRDYFVQFDTTKRNRFFNTYIKFPRKVLYQGAGVNKNELYLWLVPIGGTGLTTTAGNVANIGHQLYFKDL